MYVHKILVVLIGIFWLPNWLHSLNRVLYVKACKHVRKSLVKRFSVQNVLSFAC